MNNWYENWKKERPILGLTAGVGGGGVGNFNQDSGYPAAEAPSSAPFACTGGTINTAPVDGVQYKFHKFFNTGSATFTVQGPYGAPGLTNPPAGGYFDIFMVGGGGGGAVLGGGGGGGAVTMYSFPGGMKPGSYTVYVGDGANGYVGWNHSGASDGEPSYFQHTTSQPGPTGRIEAIGGGTGLSYSFSGSPDNPTLNQGVANGGGHSYPAPASANFWTHQAPSPSVTVPIGGASMFIERVGNFGNYSGGTASTGCCPCRGGGGGGGYEPGYSSGGGSGHRGGGNGGAGRQFNFDGNNYYWAAGGGSDSYCNTTSNPDNSNYRCNGGQGGGGGGASAEAHPSSFCLGGTGGINNGSPAGTGNGDPRPGGNGGANTGSGGGAGDNGNGQPSISGGKGGSGVIMIRYRV